MMLERTTGMSGLISCTSRGRRETIACKISFEKPEKR